MMKLSLALLVVMVAPAAAAPDARELERALGGYEHATTAEDVRRLGPGADRALIAVAQDGRTAPLRRIRAIGALRFVASVDARAFLEALLEEKRVRAIAKPLDGADVLELAAALSALAPYGREQTALELSFVAHPSAHVREAAVGALAAVGGAEVVPALQARLAVERNSGVRLAVERALTTLIEKSHLPR